VPAVGIAIVNGYARGVWYECIEVGASRQQKCAMTSGSAADARPATVGGHWAGINQDVRDETHHKDLAPIEKMAQLFKTQIVLSGPLRLGLRLARGCRFKPDRYIRVLYRGTSVDLPRRRSSGETYGV